MDLVLLEVALVARSMLHLKPNRAGAVVQILVFCADLDWKLLICHPLHNHHYSP